MYLVFTRMPLHQRGCTSGGVYVPCISNYRSRLRLLYWLTPLCVDSARTLWASFCLRLVLQRIWIMDCSDFWAISVVNQPLTIWINRCSGLGLRAATWESGLEWIETIHPSDSSAVNQVIWPWQSQLTVVQVFDWGVTWKSGYECIWSIRWSSLHWTAETVWILQHTQSLFSAVL